MNNPIDRLFDQERFDRDKTKTDSREVKPGDIFVAIRGAAHDGHDYVRDALKKGAQCVLCEHEVSGLEEEDRDKIMVFEDTRIALANIAKHIFADPSNSLSVYGVTGTNGKTTTVFLIDGILNNAARPAGLVSTVFTKVSGDVLERASITTPDSITLNRLLAEMVSSGKQAAAVEMSSHALDQKRVWGIELDSAVFTNITPEHLDYHGDMSRYLKDKSKIFQDLKPNGTGVLNRDDPMVISLAKTIDVPRLVTFGMGDNADISSRNVRLSIEGTEFDLVAGKLGSTHVCSRLIGKHNVYNILAAVAALSGSGLSLDEIGEGLERAQAVPGRLDAVCAQAPFKVFVDYAHTPDALKNVLLCLGSLATGKLICVFGCGGDRDRTKRPVMGKIATGICDRVILTSDNPRTEDPQEILRQIEKGVLKKNNYSIIERRGDPIREALTTAGEGDIVIIAGKGHEDYQITGDSRTHFEDKEAAGEVLRELGYSIT
ncbi:UDP-N-acetylmuramoyl-L-alanyl-D-glutamate--2,6-diaminopimelate ligase [Candidatus Omnitrophota bacterium]